jgi:transposase
MKRQSAEGLRAFALGRKTSSSLDPTAGGGRTAAMYTPIGSAKLNGIDSELYLRTVLAQVADHPISHIQDLLPWNLAASLRARSSQAA